MDPQIGVYLRAAEQMGIDAQIGYDVLGKIALRPYRRDAERTRRWDDQRLVEFVPREKST
jgi:hypothetical protein